jgi:transposase
VFFLDESGVDHRPHRTHARAPRGEAVCGDASGARRGRTSIISASRGGRLVSPLVFDGYCNRDVVEACFARMLLPSIPRGSVIVLDNASFHRSPALLAIVEAAGCTLMSLPTYSPDLNPIEHLWATLKRALRRGLQQAENKLLFISKMWQCYL